MTGLAYPSVSPVMISLGFFNIRWYSMAYLLGIIAAWFLIVKNIKKYKLPLQKGQIDDLIFNTTLGIILGGRLIYVLFYNTAMLWQDPLEIFAVWHGGMSFHGGLIGAIAGIYYSARTMKYPFLGFSDLIALYTPIGLFLGRLANFINDELFGRVTDVPWAVRFPNGGYLPRHPSQIYEALLEGVLLFVVLNILWRYKYIRERHGFISGMFLSVYALSRIIIENYREPDSQLGFILGSITMGQILSLPFLVIGGLLIFYAVRKKSA
ncbi:MAG: prolipoprotein diacylglyceryl transferase [Alphaproteobacteria bacterium]|nr:prolipoprotein diacylglyceryl transferase [Alphaproteobacteria bacterium]